MGGFFSGVTMYNFSCCLGFSMHNMLTHIIVLFVMYCALIIMIWGVELHCVISGGFFVSVI